MNALNHPIAAAKATLCPAPFNTRRPCFSKPLSSSSVRFPPPPPRRRLTLNPIKASLRNENPDKQLKLIKLQIDAPAVSVIPFLAPLRAAVVTTITTAAIVFAGFCFPLKPSIAASISPPPTVETAKNDSCSDEEREKMIEDDLLSNPNDVTALKSLMEVKINLKKVPEAIEIIDKLIELEPQDLEWPLLKAHMYSFNGEFELAKDVFNSLVKEDPFRVEAYHGLVTVLSQEESSDQEMTNIESRIEEMMKLCLKQNKKNDFRDFKLLLAQIKVLGKRYDEALRTYEELAKEEPRDFRPYLCQGIVYTLMRKKSEAEKNFEKYRRLIPKGHPYSSFLDDNMMATKRFAERAENEIATKS